MAIRKGIFRRIDGHGRIAIPKKVRDALSINIKDPLEIFEGEGMIILQKYTPGCVFCGELNAENFKGKLVCKKCLKNIAKL